MTDRGENTPARPARTRDDRMASTAEHSRHERWEALRRGSDADRQRLLAELKKLTGDLPPDLEHRRPCLLGPPHAYPDEPAPASYFDDWTDHDPGRMGPASTAVERRLASSCAGWPERPTAAEFHAAVHADRPDERQRALLSTWAREASYLDIVDAWGEHVYTIRELVAALHQVEGLYAFTRFRWLNRMALVPEAGGIPLWTG